MAADLNQSTALHAAAEQGQEECCTLLAATAGVDVQAPDKVRRQLATWRLSSLLHAEHAGHRCMLLRVHVFGRAFAHVR